MYISIDEGTTNIKVHLFDENLNLKETRREPLTMICPQEGWYEQSPTEIWKKVYSLVSSFPDTKVMGITNQRETTVLWHRDTGEPVYNAIVWQCRRTAEIINRIKKEWHDLIYSKTGLVPDPYFSASKIAWILDTYPKLREKAKSGKLLFGTVDTYLVWKFTKGKVHATDHTNASRTLLYSLREGWWDDELLSIFNIPQALLPEIRDSDYYFGDAEIHGRNVEIRAILGDQQASLFGQRCFNQGATKVTYGTGAFILTNTGTEIVKENGLLSTVAWAIDGRREFALEGSILNAGSAVDFLKNMGLWSDAASEESAVFFVPALSGLGAPYWDPNARALIIGLTRYTKKEHLSRAALEAVAYMVKDVLDVVENNVSVNEIKADGGMTSNEFLMQFQADILQKKVTVSGDDTTGFGAALMAAYASGNLSKEDLKNIPTEYRIYMPQKSESWAKKRYDAWRAAVKRAMNWMQLFSQ